MAYADSTKNKKLFQKTSSFNRSFICDHCGKDLVYRSKAIKHLESCGPNRTTCIWCKIVFKNRGNLARHAFFVHGDQSAIRPALLTNKCEVCSQCFRSPNNLKYHIRSVHFNLRAKIMTYDNKEINEVWHEKVYNTSKIVEIKKAANNLFLIRKLEDDTKVTVQDSGSVIDLSEVYPTRRCVDQCHICKKILLKRDLKKHYDECHFQIKKHVCNNCNKAFKRSVLFVRHVCHAKRGRRKLVL
ncbi:zinc finger protein 808-like isoform X1 [Maniola jurtina]|uniref:zinc finger protein 808-like isoform X1 n=1 Tax=Maniola jurtina TaxID=191418 RepID=UPI001E688A4A|nr:zinc finger protein 808-like isoform X1 [Maniola jurtina]